MVESSVMLLYEPLDNASHNIHLQVSVEVIVSNVPGCIDHVPEGFVLESLYNIYVILFGASPELDWVIMSIYRANYMQEFINYNTLVLYRVIQNYCLGFNNLSYKTQLR